MRSKKIAVLFSVLGLAAGTIATIGFQTHAATTTTTGTTTTTQTSRHTQAFTPPAAAGAVTAVNGNTITMTDKKTGTTYTVDATNATIEKFTAPSTSGQTNQPRPTPTTIPVSSIAVGDNIMVQGTVSGTTITATKITDGMFMGGHFGGRGMQGAMGTVSAINGKTITLTGKNGTTYTVNASGANVEKVSSSSVSNIQVGDSLNVQGTTSGTTVTAKNIVDGAMFQKPTPTN